MQTRRTKPLFLLLGVTMVTRRIEDRDAGGQDARHNMMTRSLSAGVTQELKIPQLVGGRRHDDSASADVKLASEATTPSLTGDDHVKGAFVQG